MRRGSERRRHRFAGQVRHIVNPRVRTDDKRFVVTDDVMNPNELVRNAPLDAGGKEGAADEPDVDVTGGQSRIDVQPEAKLTQRTVVPCSRVSVSSNQP